MAITATPVNKSGQAILLNDLWAKAEAAKHRNLMSALQTRLPLLAYLAGKTRGETNLGRPDQLGFVGPGVLDMVEKEMLRAAEYHVAVHLQRTGGTKNQTQRGTTASTGTSSYDQNITSSVFRWAGIQTPLKVFSSAVLTENASNQSASWMKGSVDEGMEEHFDEVATQLWRGTPTDTEANFWSEPMGVVHAMQDDTAHFYGNLQMNTTTWFGQRHVGAVTASLKLLNKAMFNPPTGVPAANRSNGFDLALTSGQIYEKLKDEAQALGQLHIVESLPGHKEIGTKFEAIRWNNTYITYDPILTQANDWSAFDSELTDTSKFLALFRSEDWVFMTHPSRNFKVDKWYYPEGEHGKDEAFTSLITTWLRLVCLRPWNQYLFTNVS